MKFVVLVVIIIVVFICILFEGIRQSKKPSGSIGEKMMRMWSKTYESLFHWGLSLIQISHADTVLDIGIGEGLSTYLISTRLNFIGFEEDNERKYMEGVVCGIDYSPKSIERAIMINRENFGTKVRLLEASVLDLPFENNLFTKITAFQTHFHWGNFDRAMSEIHRVLKNERICRKTLYRLRISEY